MDNISYLIKKIEESNLTSSDKEILIKKLNRKNPDIEGFLRKFLLICEISKEVLEYFEIDIGNFF